MTQTVLTLCDGETRVRVLLPPTALLDGEKVVVPDEAGEPLMLVDFLLVEAAREGLYGLKVLSDEPVPGANTT